MQKKTLGSAPLNRVSQITGNTELAEIEKKKKAAEAESMQNMASMYFASCSKVGSKNNNIPSKTTNNQVPLLNAAEQPNNLVLPQPVLYTQNNQPTPTLIHPNKPTYQPVTPLSHQNNQPPLISLDNQLNHPVQLLKPVTQLDYQTTFYNNSDGFSYQPFSFRPPVSQTLTSNPLPSFPPPVSQAITSNPLPSFPPPVSQSITSNPLPSFPAPVSQTLTSNPLPSLPPPVSQSITSNPLPSFPAPVSQTITSNPLPSLPPPVSQTITSNPLPSFPPPVSQSITSIPLPSFPAPVSQSITSNPLPSLPPPVSQSITSFPPPVSQTLTSNPLPSFPPPVSQTITSNPLPSFPAPVSQTLTSNPLPSLPPPVSQSLTSNPLSSFPPPVSKTLTSNPLPSFPPPVSQSITSNPLPSFPAPVSKTLTSNPLPSFPAPVSQFLALNPSPSFPPTVSQFLTSNPLPSFPPPVSQTVTSNPLPSFLPPVSQSITSNPLPFLPPPVSQTITSPGSTNTSFCQPYFFHNTQPLVPVSSSPQPASTSNLEDFSCTSFSEALSYSLGCEDGIIDTCHTTSTIVCSRCEANETIIRDLRLQNRDLMKKLTAMQSDMTTLTDTCTGSSVEREKEKEKSYFPKTRPRMHFVKYYEVDPFNPSIKEGYQQMAPGAPLAIDALWLRSALASVNKGGKGKKQKPEMIIKHLMDGFYEYKDLCVAGGSKPFLDSPIFKSLMLYAEHYLKMSHVKFVSAWNEKMSAARKTAKRLQLPM